MRAAVYVLLPFLVLALSVPGSAKAPDDNLIVPGQRIGKWTLDMTIDDLVRTNGPRNARPGRVPVALARDHRGPEKYVPDNYWLHRWDNLGLWAMTIGRETQTVVELVILSDEYRTDKGVRVGVTKEAVQSAYGPPAVGFVNPLGGFLGVYDQIGLAFGVGSNDRFGEVVQYVSIFRPGTAKQCYKF